MSDLPELRKAYDVAPLRAWPWVALGGLSTPGVRFNGVLFPAPSGFLPYLLLHPGQQTVEMALLF